MQHLWVALGKKEMLVLWGGTNPATLGYGHNINIDRSEEAVCKDLLCGRPNTFLFDNRGNGSPWKCIKNGVCMSFNSEKVMQIFSEKVLKEKPKPKKENKKKK